MIARCICLVVVAMASAAQVSTARNDLGADFYRGKTMRMLLGYGPDGGYDIYGRLVAQFLLGACRTWGVEAKFGPSEDSFCRVRRPIAIAMGQEAGVHEVRRSQKWTAAAELQPTFLKSDRLLEHLPGVSPIVVQNMPGSGSFVSAKYMNEAAPRG